MANRHRGETPLEIDGRKLALKLTLGGLAELEDALGAGDLQGLAERLGSERLAARDIIGVLRIGLKGAGHALTDAEIEGLTVAGGLEPLVSAIAAMFVAAFGTPEPAPRPPPPPAAA